jgi:hypothetical protein
MKSKNDINRMIEKITKDNQHVLDCGPATVDINAPRALMQLATTVALDNLYWVLGKIKRPRFRCDDNSKINC